MGPKTVTPPALRKPVVALTICFTLWKTLLLTIAYMSSGPGYDTSTTLLAAGRSPADVGGTLAPLATRLTRWDAIYFVKIAQRGYLHEQEWAFGWGWTRLLSLIVKGDIFSHVVQPGHAD
jgi:GPI mannosyltransferase 2